jgi:hypothetical protein
VPKQGSIVQQSLAIFPKFLITSSNSRQVPKIFACYAEFLMNRLSLFSKASINCHVISKPNSAKIKTIHENSSRKLANIHQIPTQTKISPAPELLHEVA